jgi:spoIIIJ-associated protein
MLYLKKQKKKIRDRIMIITAPTLDEAYKKASSQLNCSIIELDIEVIQHPSGGFLGMFKKEAIIKINLQKRQTKPRRGIKKRVKEKTKIINQNVKMEVENGIKNLLSSSCYDLELKSLSIEGNTVFIKIDGKDAALMIGREGYRYKALSYILHNWIKLKYDMSISLEIAEFLKNQKENVISYLESIKERVSQTGRAQTKPLDGILVKLALEELRKMYPNMYVAIKTLKNGGKVVVVNENRGSK